MTININYNHSKLVSRSEKIYIRRFSTWLVNNFIKTNVNITINLTKVDDDRVAECIQCNADKNSFIINIKKNLRFASILKAIAHEITHVRQFKNKELEIIRGKLYYNKKYVEKVDYWSRPYEIEAHGQEVALITRWMVHKNYHVTKAWAHKVLC